MTTDTNPPDSSEETGTADAADGAVPSIPSWEELGVSDKVRQALADLGYLQPMPVQTAVYQSVRAGKDMMAQAQTGTGKTAAFGIPLIDNFDDGPGVKALVLTPTRELALQVNAEFSKLAAHREIVTIPVYGGAPIKKQIDQLADGAQIVVGTPGRVLDHIRRRTLDTSGIKMLVLDECDEMLSMGFQEEIENIIERLPPKEERQTLLFSATIPGSIERIAKKHLTDPEKVELAEGGISVSEIDHGYYIVSGMARMRDLLKILTYENPESAIIFCNTRDETSTVAKFLCRHGMDAEAISSDLSQKDRERVMKRTRDKNLRFLVATDIAARGIDIEELPYVINFTFPESAEVYVHRTGRTGRAGKRGVALSLVGPREIGSFYYLKLLYKIQPEERDLPGNEVIAAVLEGEKVKKIAAQVKDDAGEEYRRLARRLWELEDGERVVAVLLKQMLTGSLKKSRSSVRNEDRSEAVAAPESADRERPAREPRERSRRGRGERTGGDRAERGGESRSERTGGDRAERGGESRSERTGGDRAERGGESRSEREPRDGARRRRRRRPRDGSESEETRTTSADSAVHEAETVVMGAGDETVVMPSDTVENLETVVVAPDKDLLQASGDDTTEEKRPRRRRSKKDDGSADEKKSTRRSKKDDDGSADEKKSTRRSKKDDDGKDQKRSRKPKKSEPESDKEFWEAWADEKQSRSDTDSDAEAESSGGSSSSGSSSSGRSSSGRSKDTATTSGDDSATVRLYINVGKREEITAEQIRDLITEGLDAERADQVGTIALRNTHAYVRVPEELVEVVIAGVEGKSVGERDVVVERARR